jgi:hypothetical protein
MHTAKGDIANISAIKRQHDHVATLGEMEPKSQLASSQVPNACPQPHEVTA